MTNIVFRADSALQLGTGHIVRCLNLAIALSERGAKITFICRDLPGNIAEQIRIRGFNVQFLPKGVERWQADAAATSALLETLAPVAWLVVDHYELDQSWERAVASQVGSILVIDDLADRMHDCAVLLDQNFYKESEKRYADLVPRSCRMLLGPRYAILSTEFRKLSQPQPRSGELKKLLIFFGGSDPDNETSKALAAIRKLGRTDLSIDIVLGAANPHQHSVRKLTDELPNAKCHVQVDYMHELMLKADLALGAGGTTTWERLRTGLPCITIAIADNQLETGRDLSAAGHIIFLGERKKVTADDIGTAIEVFAKYPPLLKQMSASGMRLVDGQGTRRITRLLMPLPVLLRAATAADCERVFEWRNAEENRRHSFDTHALSLGEHRAWYTKAIADSGRALLIGQLEGNPIGVLRFDFNETVATVSIYLLPGLGGRGLGTSLLDAGTAWIRKTHSRITTLRAEARPENVSSKGTFSAAGYTGQADVLTLQLGDSI